MLKASARCQYGQTNEDIRTHDSDQCSHSPIDTAVVLTEAAVLLLAAGAVPPLAGSSGGMSSS